jgi:hypothetical protein
MFKNNLLETIEDIDFSPNECLSLYQAMKTVIEGSKIGLSRLHSFSFQLCVFSTLPPQACHSHCQAELKQHLVRPNTIARHAFCPNPGATNQKQSAFLVHVQNN